MSKLLIALSVGLGVYLFARASRGNSLPILSSSATGLVVGDSLTAHGGYQRALAGLLPYATWENVSEVGAGVGRIEQLLRQAELPVTQGDAVVLAGVNDIASGRSLNTITEGLSRIYALLRSKGYRVIAVTTLPWAGYSTWTAAKGAKQAQLNNWIRSQPTGVDCVVDAYHAFNNGGRLISEYDSGDGIHLNNVGQVRLGREIARQAYEINIGYTR